MWKFLSSLILFCEQEVSFSLLFNKNKYQDLYLHAQANIYGAHCSRIENKPSLYFSLIFRQTFCLKEKWSIDVNFFTNIKTRKNFQLLQNSNSFFTMRYLHVKSNHIKRGTFFQCPFWTLFISLDFVRCDLKVIFAQNICFFHKNRTQ